MATLLCNGTISTIDTVYIRSTLESLVGRKVRILAGPVVIDAVLTRSTIDDTYYRIEEKTEDTRTSSTFGPNAIKGIDMDARLPQILF